MVRAMKAKPRRVWVIECPTCKKPIDWSGEGGIYFTTKKQAEEQGTLWGGCNNGFKNLTEYCGCKDRK